MDDKLFFMWQLSDKVLYVSAWLIDFWHLKKISQDDHLDRDFHY